LILYVFAEESLSNAFMIENGGWGWDIRINEMNTYIYIDLYEAVCMRLGNELMT